MRRASAIALLLMGLTVTTAIAANPHFISGPTATTSGGALTVSGTIAGLGNQDVTIVVSATATTTCTNGGNNSPGRTGAEDASGGSLCQV